jgi:hypothetical protein
MMTDNQRSYQRDVRGRFTKVDPERDVIAAGLGAPREYAYELTARYAPAGDDLAQGGQGSPLRARRPTMVDPDDEGYHNGIMRAAARGAATDDPTAWLVGLESHGVATGVTAEDGTSVTTYGDGGRTMSPRRAEDIDPRRR